MGHAAGQIADRLHFLRLAQLFLDGFAVGDVPHRGDHNRILADAILVQTDLNREFAAVLVKGARDPCQRPCCGAFGCFMKPCMMMPRG